jgi:hypothetical protein
MSHLFAGTASGFGPSSGRILEVSAERPPVMPETNADGRHGPQLNPQALRHMGLRGTNCDKTLPVKAALLHP